MSQPNRLPGEPKTSVMPDESAPRPKITAARIGLIIAVTAVVGLGVVTAVTWQRHRLVTRIRQSMPPVPAFENPSVQLKLKIDEATAALSSAKTAMAAVADLGRVYQANAYRQAAEACWRCLMREQPTEPRWRYYLAGLLQFDGRTVEAEEQLKRVVTLQPDYAPAWLELASLRFKSGDIDEARESFQRRLQLLPKDPYAALGLARIAWLRGQRDEARTQLETLLRETAAFSPALNLYAEILAAEGKNDLANEQRWQGRMAGRFREASDPWLEELRADCFDPSQLAVWGKIDFQAKFGDRGKSLFLRAIEVAPQNPIGFEAMGEWYLEDGDLAAALKSFTQAVQLPRPSITLFQNLAETFRRMNEPTEALRALQLGLTAIPETSELYYELGVTFDQMNRGDDATAAYQKAIALSPNAAAAHVNLAVILLKQNRRAEAYEHLQLALKAQPTLPKALAMLADLEMASGQLEAASAYVTPLYTYYPGMPRARRTMAQWHVLVGSAAAERGKPADAEREYLEALKIDPESIDAQGKLGILYGQSGRYQDALARFEAVHRMQPNDPRPAMFLGMAYAQLGQVAEARRVLTEGEQLATKVGNTDLANRCRELLRRLPQ